MRTDCRHYESRTYRTGEIVRKCRLDLAPEAPWRCPAECPSFEQRRFDVGWQYGSLAKAGSAPEAEPEGADIAALLDEAEDIVNSAAPEIFADFEQKRGKGVFRRKGKPKKGKKKR
jgi:hypothetical protein